MYPAPLSEETEVGPEDQSDADWNKAVAALQRAWASLGFEYFRDGVHVLDLSLVTLDEKLGQLRENAERYCARRRQQASHQPGDTPTTAAPNIPGSHRQ